MGLERELAGLVRIRPVLGLVGEVVVDEIIVVDIVGEIVGLELVEVINFLLGGGEGFELRVDLGKC